MPGKRHCFIIQPEERQREQGHGSKRDGIGPSAIFDFLYKWGMLLTVVLLVAVFGLASDNFLDPFNIINILRSIAIVTVIAIGVSISLTIGGFDLSVGSTASLANALVISCLSGMARDHRSDSDNPRALHHWWGCLTPF